MDVVFLSRLQFAATTLFHFLFVPLTLGLSMMVAYMETKYVRTKDPVYLSMTKFWGKIFLINFAVGVVTGITLEFQFGTNWSKYSAYVGDIFGPLLAIEASIAFFLESTFIGIWIFGWKKLSAKAHAFVMWLVAIGGSFSAIWILIANAWMQNPVGYTIRNGRAELTDFMAVITQEFAVLTILHTLLAAYVVSAFFVMGISAWHLLKKNQVNFFKKSFRLALFFGLFSTIFLVIEGDFHAVDVAKVQPAKLAAMETHWETKSKAPVFLFSWPDEENERNYFEIGEIPGVLSLLAFHDINAPVKGLKDFPKDERPPVAITAISFKIMVGLGFYFFSIMIMGWFFRNKFEEKRWFLWLMVFSLPLPYIACEFGWVLAEVGRQPWIVYGLLKTADAVSPVSAGQVLTSLIGFIVLYGLLGLAGFYMIFKNAKKGPQDLNQG